jgi:uncharacterized protein (DUF488 family)
MNTYTLGYQSLNPDTYIQALLNFGVKIVVDVRENSWSQRPAYVGSTLMKSLQQPTGIALVSLAMKKNMAIVTAASRSKSGLKTS